MRFAAAACELLLGGLKECWHCTRRCAAGAVHHGARWQSTAAARQSTAAAWVQASSCSGCRLLRNGILRLEGSILRPAAATVAADAGYNGMAATPGARPAVSRGPPAAAGHESYRVCPLFIESITPEHWDACIVHAASIHESHDASSWAPDASTCSNHGRLADAPLGGAGAARAGGAGGAERVVGLRPPTEILRR